MTIRKLLPRVPILGPIVERRWIPDSAARDRHQDLVRGRLPGTAASSDSQPDPMDTQEMPGP